MPFDLTLLLPMQRKAISDDKTDGRRLWGNRSGKRENVQSSAMPLMASGHR